MSSPRQAIMQTSFGCLLLLLLCGGGPISGQSQVALKGAYHECSDEQEGQEVMVNISKTSKARCRCTNNILDSCKVESPDCQDKVFGCHFVKQVKDNDTSEMCSSLCEGCLLDDGKSEYKSGQAWRSPDSCTVSQCFSGVATRTQVQCPHVTCSNPVQLLGQCCLSCPSCVLGPQVFEEGEQSPSIMDPCNECTCKNNMLNCIRKACPVLPCNESMISYMPGQCCPVCRQPNPMFTELPEHECIFRDKFYQPGAQFSPDPCTTCSCLPSSTVSCHRQTCPTLPCAKSQQIMSQDDQCCPTCITSAPMAIMAAAQRPDQCKYKGNMFMHGHSWKDNCLSCSCTHGEIKCAKKECPTLACPKGATLVQKEDECCPRCHAPNGVCTVFGDPHYKTFDGRIFNFQGSCKYLLAYDCKGKEYGHSKHPSFEIRITNDARDSVAFSWVRVITMRFYGTKVSLLQNNKVNIDGKRVSLPFIKMGSFSIMKDNYRVILRTNEGMRIVWDGISFFELSVPPKFQNHLCGLCGNFNGDKYDDFVGRHGHLNFVDNNQAFGNSWKVGGLKACSVLPRDMPVHYEPQCKQSWESKIQSDRNCNAIRSRQVFGKCLDIIDVNYYLNACKLDMCECPSNQCHCEVLTAFARECERATGEVVHGWRAATDCINVTSFNWRHHQHSHINSSEGTFLNKTINEVLHQSKFNKDRVQLGADENPATQDEATTKAVEHKPTSSIAIDRITAPAFPGCNHGNQMVCDNEGHTSERKKPRKTRRNRKKQKRRRKRKKTSKRRPMKQAKRSRKTQRLHRQRLRHRKMKLARRRGGPRMRSRKKAKASTRADASHIVWSMISKNSDSEGRRVTKAMEKPVPISGLLKQGRRMTTVEGEHGRLLPLRADGGTHLTAKDMEARRKAKDAVVLRRPTWQPRWWQGRRRKRRKRQT